MAASAILARTHAIQAALSAFSILNMTSYLYPQDTLPQDGASVDYIVIGGGTAGCVVGARLVEAGFYVLIVEAGGVGQVESYFPGLAPYIKNSSADWYHTSNSDCKTGNCHRTQGLLVPKVLGGATAVDFMIYSRGGPSNYKKWAEAANDDSWNFDTMTQYFKKLENLKDPTILNSEYKKYFGIGGKVNITRDPNDVCDDYIKGFKLAGEPTYLDNVGNSTYGYSRALYNIDNGVRNDAALSYITPIKNNHRLRISFHSVVTKILFDGNKNAIGAEFVKNGKTFTVKAKKEVILSAGAIKSPQILMLSGIGLKKELKKWNISCISDIPVGKNLQNFIGVYLTFKTNRTIMLEQFNAHKFPSALVVGHSTVKKTDIDADYQTLNFIIDDRNFFLTMCVFTFGFNNSICDTLNRNIGTSNQILNTILFNLKIESRGHITLASTNVKDVPDVKPGYYTSDRDLELVVDQIQHYMSIIQTPYFKKMGVEFLQPNEMCNYLGFGTREYWRCYVLCMTAATARFVRSNSMGEVVDRKLCVKGVNKLRVVDASVIPSTISGTISGTVLALAEKGADIIIAAAN